MIWYAWFFWYIIFISIFIHLVLTLIKFIPKYRSRKKLPSALISDTFWILLIFQNNSYINGQLFDFFSYLINSINLTKFYYDVFIIWQFSSLSNMFVITQYFGTFSIFFSNRWDKKKNSSYDTSITIDPMFLSQFVREENLYKNFF